MQALQAIQRIFAPRLRDSVRDLADAALGKRGGRHRVIHASMRVVDDEYAFGRWDYLSHLKEMTRYAVIAGYCQYDRDVASVLDLGCGTGVLRRWLRPTDAIDYVGVDLSNVAIETARRGWTEPSSKFVAMDVASFAPDRKFDAIVFNEVLYYFERPDQILTRFAKFLEPNGRLVISLWDSPESRLAWRRSSGTVHVVDEVRVRHRSGVSWQIHLCRPRRPLS